MTKDPSAKMIAPLLQGEAQDLVPRPMLLPDEDEVAFDGLREALLADLAPGTPYEQILAENLVALEWEAVRHRRMRDHLILGRYRELAAGIFDTGKLLSNYRGTSSGKARNKSDALVGQNRKQRRAAELELSDHNISPSEILANAYQQVGYAVKVHESRIAEIETRRRRLREDYDRLRARKRPRIADAEIVAEP